MTPLPTQCFNRSLSARRTRSRHRRAHWHAPTTGSFTSRDPLGYAGGDANLYRYCANNPVSYVDPSGMKIKISGSDEFKKRVQDDLDKLRSKPHGRELVEKLEKSRRVITITESHGRDRTRADGGKNAAEGGNDSTIQFNPNAKHRYKVVDENGSDECPSYVILGHELGHAEENAAGTASSDDGTDENGKGIPGTIPPTEKNSMHRERQIRKEHGLPDRPWYYLPEKYEKAYYWIEPDEENPFKEEPCSHIILLICTTPL
jgi:RHS repeat-associated protein